MEYGVLAAKSDAGCQIGLYLVDVGHLGEPGDSDGAFVELPGCSQDNLAGRVSQ